MTQHPYQKFPASNYWKRSIAGTPLEMVDPVVQSKFRILATDRVATAGSCFAQHIARHLKASGFNFFLTEQAHPVIPESLATAFGYGVYTARYGNVYTSRQLLQLLRRAYGLYSPCEDVWAGNDGKLVDPFRPQIQPGGFESEAEYLADRLQHFAAIRRAVEDLDVFVLTLGLTETWVSKEDGAAYPLCPGVAGGVFDENKYKFLNLRATEVVADLHGTMAFIWERNPSARVILTVSPVPLIATAENRSVLVSTTYSKAVLRVAAEEIANSYDQVAYFPSFEIITGAHTRGKYFEDDLRSVTEEGVRRVMSLFMHHFTETGGAAQQSISNEDPERSAQLRREQLVSQAMAVMCDEEALDR